MFYSDLYRRHLLDMHIDEWDESFLSQFDPEEYVENLKRAKVNYAMLYLQSHVGLCYYPTKTGKMHRAFEKEPGMMRRLVELCHQAGIAVCGYYSLNYNTYEHDRHPDWRMLAHYGQSRRENGSASSDDLAFASPKQARYGLCCPNNPAYREFVEAQVNELIDYFDCDALFFDMPFWVHTCHCEHCRKAFGKEIPQEATRELVEFKARTMGAFVQWVTDLVKTRRPDMPVEHNCAQAVAPSCFTGCMEEVMNACDYVGGDLYGDLYNHSFACKFYRNATRHQPFEQMLSRCKPSLQMHTLTKSPDQLKTAVCSTMQHHGATLLIDAIDPVGTMDSRVYDQLGQLFAFHAQYEPWFTGNMVEQVGIYYGLRSRAQGSKITSLTCCSQAGRTLIRSHIPFCVTGSFHTLEGYDIIVAPWLSDLEEGDNARLAAFVEQGGTLYLSGSGNAKLVEKLTGNRILENSKEVNMYVAPKAGWEETFWGFNAKYPLPFEVSAAIAQPGDGQVIATLTFPYTKPDDVRFASIHSNPPGIATEHPAVTVSKYGKGTVVWSALPFENMQWEEYRQIFLKLLHLGKKPEYFFCSDAPVNVELVAFRNSDSVTVSAVVLDEEHNATPALPFTVKVRCQAKKVTLVPTGEEIPFTAENGCTTFTTRKLHIFDMYQLHL